MELKWYAVYTRSRMERKVADQLNKINIENYCPLNKVLKQWSDRKKLVEEPLFTSYVFVKVSQKQMNSIRLVYGVVNFVCWLGKPAVILASEIELIKKFLSEHNNVKLERVILNINDRVKIIQGPFMEMEGSIVALKKRKVKVLIPSLRYIMTAEIEKEDVMVVHNSLTPHN
ncbi:MAG: NusG antitermination factor [Mucilaginibacter sp.]|nr:NusG antitermination factor [Mucilaginibacter sp.]